MTAPQRLFGLHTVTALLERRPGDVRRLLVQSGGRATRLTALLERAAAAGIPVEELPRRELDRLAGGGRHQGVVAETAAPASGGETALLDMVTALEGPALLLVLDGVQDPHNLGACLRTADAAGAHGVVIPRDRAVGLNATARKVASGAAETLPLFTVTNLARTLAELRDAGVWVFGAAGEAEATLWAQDLTGPTALVLGAEGRGLRRLTRERCDVLVRIPMAGAVASLNVSVAAGVALFEARRQRDPGGAARPPGA